MRPPRALPRRVPSATELEREHGVLGVCLLESAAVPLVAPLDPTLFYKDANQRIVAALRTLHEAGAVVTALTLTDELERRGELEAVGGQAYLATLTEDAVLVPLTALPGYIARLQADAAKRTGARGWETLSQKALRNGAGPTAETLLREHEDLGAELRRILGTATAADARSGPATPWALAMPAPAFLAQTDPDLPALVPRVLYAEQLTEIYSPRGIGKSLYGHALAVALARAGQRVLLVDRDNPPREVRRRLRGWGAEATPTLEVLTRERAPALTAEASWRVFPWTKYDLVMVDSLDSASEGVGEKDSSKPSKAIAALLDVAHRDGGPAVLAFGNTVKSGEHARGSGVVEDRGDLSFEVRDATGFQPTGRKPWWEELPEAGAGDWAARATRRKRQTVYRLAFTCTKFRPGETPDPFMVELDLSAVPWQLREVTADVEADAERNRTAVEQERQALETAATEALRLEVLRCAAAGAPVRTDKDAIPFLRDQGLRRAAARRVIEAGVGTLWRTVTLADKRGKPRVLLPLADGSGEADAGPPTISAAGPSGDSPGSFNPLGGNNRVAEIDSPDEDSQTPLFPPPHQNAPGGNQTRETPRPERESGGGDYLRRASRVTTPDACGEAGGNPADRPGPTPACGGSESCEAPGCPAHAAEATQ